MDQLKAAFAKLPFEEAAKEAFMYKNKLIGKFFETIRKASIQNKKETKLFLNNILIKAEAEKTKFKIPHTKAKPTETKTPVQKKIKTTTVKAPTPVQEKIKAITVDLKTAEKKATTTHVQEEIKVKEPNKQKHDAKRRSTSEILPPKKAKTSESFLDHLFAFKNGETKPHHTVLHSLKKELAKDYTIPEGNEVISPQIFAESVDFIESYISEQVEKDIDTFAMNVLASLKLIKDLKQHCEQQNTNYEVKFELNICV